MKCLLLKNSTKFCPHFHLSLQSANDKTLRSMNRFYKTEDYLSLIDKINETFENPFLGSDVIAGFAGETDEDFEITKQNLEKSGLTQIHTFPYSQRKGQSEQKWKTKILMRLKANELQSLKRFLKENTKNLSIKI